MSIGGAVLGRLQNDHAYENLYFDGKRQDVPGLKTSKNNRPLLIESLQNRLLGNSVKINSKRFVGELKTFIFNPTSKRPEAQRGKHGDAIMAMSIAVFVRDVRMRDLPVGSDTPEEIKEIYSSDMYKEIKKEILQDAFDENWLEPQISSSEEDDLGVAFELRRANDKILKEFGW